MCRIIKKEWYDSRHAICSKGKLNFSFFIYKSQSGNKVKYSRSSGDNKATCPGNDGSVSFPTDSCSKTTDLDGLILISDVPAGNFSSLACQQGDLLMDIE